MPALTNRLKGWITIGGSPGEGGDNEGGTPVFLDDDGKISRGPASLTGRHIGEVDQGKRPDGEKPKPPKKPKEPDSLPAEGEERPSADRPPEHQPRNRLGGKLGRVGAADAERQDGEPGEGDAEGGGGVAPTAGRPSDAAAGGSGGSEGEPAGAEASQDVPRRGDKAKRLEAVNRLKGHAEQFRKDGKNDQADWLDQLRAHVKSVGVEAAIEALGEEMGDGGPARVQYGGAFDELGETAEETQFVKEYLDSCGITIMQQGSAPDLSTTAIWSLPLPEAAETPGGFVPADEFFENKLEEAKNLPGLESSEDIDKVVGSKVTQFTSEVVEKLDETYGKGKWIVKSYGDEAFAGFGIFFPQRVKQMQLNAKQEFADAKSELKDRGYRLAKDGDRVVGVKKGGKTVSVGSPEYADLPRSVQRLGKQASIAAQRVNGAMLPMSPEDSLKNEYGIVFRRDADGAPVGITNWDGKDYDFDDPAYKKIEEMEGGAAGHSLHRALETDEKKRSGGYVEPRFMVQPAFEAVGVTDFDRAVGATWETAKEGRVHCVTRDGKTSIIPYATLLGRGDSLPTVIQSEDSKAMEKAVQEAIDKLPESKRRGQVYAPDVMKTKDGWRVIELNPSEASGGSAWLGGNPFVIDAMVSHLVGREPQHVKFMRDLLKGKDVEVPKVKSYVQKAGTCKPGQTAATTGCTPAEGGGGKRAVKEPVGKSNTVRYGSYRASYSLHNRKRIAGPSIPLPNYQQQDEHSCGFVAALTVARYHDPSLPAEDVLRAVKPTVSGGIDRRGLVKALKELGVDAAYTEDLTVPKLRAYVDRGTPVLVTMWLEDYDTDHWTAVQGFDGDRIHLTNYGSLTVAQFRKEWYTPGLGVVCRKKPGKAVPANRLVTKQQLKGPVAAGLAVVASDTGRVLMVQRPLEDGNPNGGKWEFPGGTIDDGETPWEAALREWREETGLEWPENDDTGVRDRSWTSRDGTYRGYVAWVPGEDSLDLSQRDWFSDPDSEVGAVVAWVHPRDLPQHNLRPALLSDVDQVVAAVSKWLLGSQVQKSTLTNRLKGLHDLPPLKYKPGDRVQTLVGSGTVVRIGGGGKTDHFGISAPKLCWVKLDADAKYGWGGREMEFDPSDLEAKSNPVGCLKSSFFEACDRDEEGHCIAGTGGAASRAGQAAGQALHTAGEVEHKIKEAVGRNFERLPKSVQQVVTATLKVAFVAFTAGQALAERVARERGMTEVQASQLRGTLATLDLLAFKGAKVGALSGVPGAGLATAVSGSVPIVSAGYLAYSSVRNPQATYRAAKGLAREAVARAKQRLARKPSRGSTPTTNYKPSLEQVGRSYTKGKEDTMKTVVSPSDAARLAGAMAAHDYDDWYFAVLTAALEEAAGDVEVAIAAAEEAYQQQPPEEGDEGKESKSCCVFPTNRLHKAVMKTSTDQVLAAMNQLGNGRDKFTSLADLGRRLGGSPEALHAAVMQLWRAGKITVAKPEGRHGSTPEERRWWLEAQGETLGYVMLRR